ncbi:hypothetical protein [uncultured Aquimarina sp.]|uniref:hypothetical protein n=1 Tax=uncultured Aquimarina sp. TaxID=575652 RepID=UPI00260C5D8E|nr:hypothetical protein [uncultured Aquimarina sp.]
MSRILREVFNYDQAKYEVINLELRTHLCNLNKDIRKINSKIKNRPELLDPLERLILIGKQILKKDIQQ